VHDINDLEGLGLPAVFVASAEFREAAAAQARALGFDPARVFVPHPVQDRTDAEMRVMAEAAADPILSQLVA
jgi:hypothetical protein